MVRISKKDFDFARILLKDKERLYYCVHFCHQAIEKLLKAVIQEYTDKIPLRTHNLPKLLKQGGLKSPKEKEEFLLTLNPHYVKIGRAHV